MNLILTVVISESKSEMVKIVLVSDSCPLFPLRCIDKTMKLSSGVITGGCGKV